VVIAAPRRGLVSVVVAGGGPGLQPSLRSAAAQTYGSTEIVVAAETVAGNGLGSLGSIAAGVRVLPPPEGGLAEARSAAVAATDGQYVAFLHPGDAWSPEKLSRQVALMEAHPDLGLVFTRARIVDTLGEGGPPAPADPVSRAADGGEPVVPAPGGEWEALFEDGIAQRDPARTYARLLTGDFVPYSSMLARRVALPIEGPFRGRYRRLDVHDMVLRTSELRRFGFVAEPLTTCPRRPPEPDADAHQRALEALDLFRDNLARNPWLAAAAPSELRRRERSLLAEAGRLLARAGRGAEARPLLLRAWRKGPLDLAIPAILLEGLVFPRRRAPRAGEAGGG
jgi:hypothetical protein